MAKASPSQEPSMEEILASIRRIISDEPKQVEAAATASAPAADDEVISEDDLDKLFAQGDSGSDDLADEPVTDDLGIVEGLLPDEAEIAFVDPSSDEADDEVLDLAGFEDEIEEPEAEPEAVMVEDDIAFEPPPPPPPPPRANVRQPEPLPLVDEVEPLVSDRVGASVNAAFGQLSHTILAANARTLDDLVKEMLRPMLKGWLDENLPVIVERLVRAEIERVSRGR